MACQSHHLGMKGFPVTPHAGAVVAAHRSAFADDESSAALPQALDQAQASAVHPAATSGQAPPSSHALFLPPGRAPVEATLSQAGPPGPGESSVTGSAQAATALAAQERPVGQTPEAALQRRDGSASPTAPPLSSGDQGEGRPGLVPWQRARALSEERDLATRLRQHVAEVSGPSTCQHAKPIPWLYSHA